MEAKEDLRKRYAGRRLYDGHLCEDNRLSWMHRTRPIGLSYACRLPECQVKLVRTQETQPRWFCCPEHAAESRRRRAALRDRIEELELAMNRVQLGRSGRPTTEEGRALASDLVFLKGLQAQYE